MLFLLFGLGCETDFSEQLESNNSELLPIVLPIVLALGPTIKYHREVDKRTKRDTPVDSRPNQ